MRDKQILALRQELDIPTQDSTAIEAFQNKTLRPILKLQDAITKQMLDNSEHFSKMIATVNKTDKKALNSIISKYFSSNIVFKSKLIGSILGMMTSDELSFYFQNTSEVNKRIATMQRERFMDGFNR